MQHYEWKLLMISHQPTEIFSHRHCGSVDIMFLISYMALPDHVPKDLCIGGKLSW